MSKYKDASDFEELIVEILGQHGFWASKFPPDKDGTQPCDVIAMNHKGKHLIDAKLCSSPRFKLERMEDNQISSIDAFVEKCGGRGWFAIGYPDDKIYMIEKWRLCMIRDAGAKSISKIPDNLRIEVWLREHSDFK